MIIRLNDIQCFAYHGVLDEERKKGNFFRVNVSITLDTPLGVQTDDIQHTLDYRCVCDVVQKEMAIRSDLIEYVAWRIKQALVQAFPQALDVHVTVAKKNPPLPLPVAWAEVEM